MTIYVFFAFKSQEWTFRIITLLSILIAFLFLEMAEDGRDLSTRIFHRAIQRQISLVSSHHQWNDQNRSWRRRIGENTLSAGYYWLTEHLKRSPNHGSLTKHHMLLIKLNAFCRLSILN